MSSQPGGDMLVKILTLYPDLSAEWLMRGEGDVIKGISPNINTNPPDISSSISSLTISEVPSVILDKFLTTIQEQAEEIGQLREQIAQLQREKGKNAGNAQVSDIASVG